jgi:hypothetical protein
VSFPKAPNGHYIIKALMKPVGEKAVNFSWIAPD